MKKLMKKMGSLFLTLCVAVSCFSFSVYAAQGELQFSDPTGEAGSVIEVRMRVISDSGAIGSYEIKCSYDTSLLRFESSPGAEASDGTITFTSSTNGTQTDVLQTIRFTALNEGVSKIEVTGYEAALTSGEDLVLTLGDSTVTVRGGTPVQITEPPQDGPAVDVNGVTYTVDSGFKEKDIPMGFVAVDTELNGAAVRAMILENGDQYMYYLKDGAGESDYFLYDSEDGSFTLTEPVLANNQLTLFLMNHDPEFELPEKFWKTTMTINKKEFAIWNNMDNQDYYLVYAMNNSGTYGYYQYDAVESTYQRMNMTELKVEEKEHVDEQPQDSNLIMFFKKNLKPVLIAMAALIALLLIIIIILAGKLSRKADYEQYEYDYYDEPEKKSKKRGGRKKHKEDQADEEEYPQDQSQAPEEYVDEADSGYDDYEEEDVDFDGQGDEFGADDFESEDYDDDGYDVDFSEDDDPGLNDEPQDDPGKNLSWSLKQKNKKDSDDFPIDFIEL